MAQYAMGGDEAFGALYDALSPRLYAFLTRHVRSMEAAKDLLQQTFLQLHVNRGKFTPGKSVAAYAFAITRRLCIDASRRTRPEQPFPDDDAAGALHDWLAANAFDEAIDAKAALETIESEFLRWPSDHQHAFELVYSDGLSHAEVAAIFGTTANAMKLRMSRLRGLLEAAMHATSKCDRKEPPQQH